MIEVLEYFWANAGGKVGSKDRLDSKRRLEIYDGFSGHYD